MDLKRFSIVPELSSAARMPLPGATSALAVAARSSVVMVAPSSSRAARPRVSMLPQARRTCGHCSQVPRVGPQQVAGHLGVAVVEVAAEPLADLYDAVHPADQVDEDRDQAAPLDPPLEGDDAVLHPDAEPPRVHHAGPENDVLDDLTSDLVVGTVEEFEEIRPDHDADQPVVHGLD